MNPISHGDAADAASDSLVGPVLGVETSCDETGLALYDPALGLIGERLHSQVALHAPHGGVVPELASRDHIRRLLPLLNDLLRGTGHTRADLAGVAYTGGPGPVGALVAGRAAPCNLLLSVRRLWPGSRLLQPLLPKSSRGGCCGLGATRTPCARSVVARARESPGGSPGADATRRQRAAAGSAGRLGLCAAAFGVHAAAASALACESAARPSSSFARSLKYGDSVSSQPGSCCECGTTCTRVSGLAATDAAAAAHSPSSATRIVGAAGAGQQRPHPDAGRSSRGRRCSYWLRRRLLPKL